MYVCDFLSVCVSFGLCTRVEVIDVSGVIFTYSHRLFFFFSPSSPSYVSESVSIPMHFVEEECFHFILDVICL